MLTSVRGAFTATLVSGLALSAAPALANENLSDGEFDLATLEAAADVDIDVSEIAPAKEPVADKTVNKVGGDNGITLSGNVALVTEYRFRGVDLSGGEIAIQGGVDLSHESGFYAGTWASSLDEDTVGYGSTEVDVYAGFGGDLAEGVSFDIGGIVYMYPDAGAGDFDYYEFYGSVGFGFGPAEATVGVAYAPDQDSLGDSDNFYIYTDVAAGIPDTPISLTAHLGYTDGFLTFTNDGKAFDWSLGLDVAVGGPVSIGVSYVGVEGDIPAGAYDFTDDAVVFTLSASI
ncbi:hypothetical protein BPTFM16_00218 [Altererythrobacter insulae]|nr:hypothetical protein BPTFM16_00218 [Altererythrobacter insulae]